MTIYPFAKRSMGLGRLNPFNVAGVIEVNNRTKRNAAYPSDHAHTNRTCCGRIICPENTNSQRLRHRKMYLSYLPLA